MSENVTRYMSFERCIDIIDKGKIYLARFDSFDDKLEGHSLTQLVKKAKIELEGLEEEKRNKLPSKERKRILFASCWFNGGENLSMWDRYRANRGMALRIKKSVLMDRYEQSDLNYDFEVLCDSYNNLDRPQLRDKYTGDITYVSENNRSYKKYRLGLIKHHAFEHEHEYRLVIRQNGNKNHIRANGIFWNVNGFDSIPITIITNPYMEDTMFDLMKSFVQKKKLKNVSVMKSKFRTLFRD